MRRSRLIPNWSRFRTTDAILCDYIRAPFARYGGALAAVRTDDIAAHPIRMLLTQKADLLPSVMDEVLFGRANQLGGDDRNVVRMAGLLAGLPESAPGAPINRLCGSGLDAVGSAA